MLWQDLKFNVKRDTEIIRRTSFVRTKKPNSKIGFFRTRKTCSPTLIHTNSHIHTQLINQNIDWMPSAFLSVLNRQASATTTSETFKVTSHHTSAFSVASNQFSDREKKFFARFCEHNFCKTRCRLRNNKQRLIIIHLSQFAHICVLLMDWLMTFKEHLQRGKKTGARNFWKKTWKLLLFKKFISRTCTNHTKCYTIEL